LLHNLHQLWFVAKYNLASLANCFFSFVVHSVGLYSSFALQVAVTVLYAVDTGILFNLKVNTNRLSAEFALFMTVLLGLYKLFQMLFEIIALKSYYAIASVVSVILQASTVNILYKLRGKIIAASTDTKAYDAENPPVVVATPLA